MDYSQYAEKHHLDITIDDRVALVKMNRPDTRNTMNNAMHVGLERLLPELGIDADVGAIVLTGAGTDFSIGGDLDDQERARERGVKTILREAKYIVQSFANCEAPIIAAVNGTAAQVGATIALMCDIVYMADNARIADDHVRTALVAGDGGGVIWPLLVGPHRAKEYLMTGDSVDAATADRIGLVNYVVPADDLLEAATAFARRLAEGPGLAIRWTKMSINRIIWQNLNLVLEMGLATEAMSVWTKDHKEALAAIREDRQPRFRDE